MSDVAHNEYMNVMYHLSTHCVCSIPEDHKCKYLWSFVIFESAGEYIYINVKSDQHVSNVDNSMTNIMLSHGVNVDVSITT